jgi:hypothetical protein
MFRSTKPAARHLYTPLNLLGIRTQERRFRMGLKWDQERSWIILGEDGRHITLGRSSDPTNVELAQAKAGLAGQGLSGWLAVMDGSYYMQGSPNLLMVDPICNPRRSFADAVAAFHIERKKMLDGLE